MFEVWVERQKLLSNLNLASAISSFLHLCFCFDLKYPKVICLEFYLDKKVFLKGGETVADLFQRAFAKYGDKSGEI